jgi:putative addiction module component (TIGR02574 family)
MAATTLSDLLKLPAEQRAELAMALWETLTDAERQAELTLTPEQEEELDRRWAEHLENPSTAISWDEVRRKLRCEAICISSPGNG